MKITIKYLISFLFLALTSLSVAAHPFYVSICEIHFNSETDALEISLKTYSDDLSAALALDGHKNLYLGEVRENPDADQLIMNYLSKVLHFKVNDKTVEYQFIGKELEDAVVWTYLEISDVPDLENIEVDCTLFTEVYETQSNVIQVEKNKTIKSLLLNKRERSGTISF